MAVQIKQDQAYAYSEILEILSHMEEEYVNRIPKKLIDLFKLNSLPDYENHLTTDKPLEEQGISEKTSSLLALLMLKYWCDTPQQKQELQNIFDENERKYQEELRNKYNPDNIFNNEKQETTNTTITQVVEPRNKVSVLDLDEQSITNNSTLPMDYNSFPWYKKLFTKVRNFFYKIFKIEKNPT